MSQNQWHFTGQHLLTTRHYNKREIVFFWLNCNNYLLSLLHACSDVPIIFIYYNSLLILFINIFYFDLEKKIHCHLSERTNKQLKIIERYTTPSRYINIHVDSFTMQIHGCAYRENNSYLCIIPRCHCFAQVITVVHIVRPSNFTSWKAKEQYVL